MATVAHYIYSHYTPAKSTAPVHEEESALETNETDPWQIESSLGARRRLAGAPRFVPAIVSYDEINGMIGMPATLQFPQVNELPRDVSSWYRSLTRSASFPPGPPLDTAPNSPLPSHLVSGLSAPTSTPRPRQRQDNSNWFIARALRSEPATSCSTPTQTLADILARDPPPLSKEEAFTPPVFLTLGPSNKGFAMLQQSGWSEGEPLGPGVRRRFQPHNKARQKSPKRGDGGVGVKQEERLVQWDPDGDVTEIKQVDVIDLTFSDSEDNEPAMKSDQDLAAEDDDGRHFDDVSSAVDPPSHNPNALLTPLPTILKSDRLGIGLKAKTTGPYKASKKRVTHNAAALASHIRANEEMRRMKKVIGRGTRGFARLAKAEAESRRRLLASLNDS
ncbi:uncharacterized protein FIBRA_05692 [Fibroporia radiculosa]|uniref:G-patch domain-containing protein n=1 Tax=Fibroporia radiculosa TaxID=599839 RepID=J4IAV2_9APHY|nr:uncharacterized protein FIBRA_05692 [Fibroporia radiculosa]CCM03556.1 predicted protein [Fibroporia radiculosa]